MPAPSGIRGQNGPPFSPAATTQRASHDGGGFSASAASMETSALEGTFLIAFDDDWNVANPTWTDLGDAGGPFGVARYSIDRGRRYELDRVDTGTATIEVVDEQFLLDPTNTTSPYYGKVDPMRQAAIGLQNPVTGDWSTIYRGFIRSVACAVDVTESHQRVTFELVDAFTIFARCEVVPDDLTTFGNAVPSESEGDVVYESATVQDRILAALTDAQWSGTLTPAIFSGNVIVKATVYASGNSILTVIRDAADAEFPFVASFYVSKDGLPTFHGRLARFDPDAYGTGSANISDGVRGIEQWTLVDTANA